MTLNQLFLGKPLHWLLWLMIAGVLWWLGSISFHVRHFIPFCFILLALAGTSVVVILMSYREGDRITREPFDEA
jgi:hypothetical protein